VALSGDFLVVGAVNHSVLNEETQVITSYRGAAYFFRREAATNNWVFETKEMLRDPEMVPPYVESYPPNPIFNTKQQPSFGWSSAMECNTPAAACLAAVGT
jgi:YHS domain-containing protein